MGKDWDKFGGKPVDRSVNPALGIHRYFKGNKPVYNWDLHKYQEFCYKWATELYRVMKPGAHILVFGGTRTYHRMACAVEDAGFQVRDMVEWIYGCVDEKTEILTKDGWKNHEMIEENDDVCSFDIETEELSYNRVKNIYKYPYNDWMYKIKGRTLDQLLTPNHRVLLKETHQIDKRKRGEKRNPIKYETEWKYVESKDLRPYSDLRFPLAGRYIGKKSIGVELAELIGWVISEGSYNKRNGGIYIRQTEVNLPYIERIRYLLKKLDLFYSETVGTYPYKDRTYTVHDFYIRKDRAQLIKNIIPNKKPTKELLDLKQEELLALFIGLVNGDGSYNKNSGGKLGSFYQKDESVLDWFQVLCLHLGFKSSKNQRKQSVSWGKKSWAKIDHGWFKRKVYQERYNGIVWCIETKIGNFVARRNGKIFITGNSGFSKSLDIGKQIDKNSPRMNMFKSFAEHFRYQRENKGLTHKDIGKHFLSKTGGLTGCVWNWENGMSVPTLEQWKILQSLLGLSDKCLPLIERIEAEREVIGKKKKSERHGYTFFGDAEGHSIGYGEFDITASTTEEAIKWNGWGTGLKPAHEPILFGRKPISERNIASNVLKWGCGGMNIDGCRISIDKDDINIRKGITANAGSNTFKNLKGGIGVIDYKDGNMNKQGRFPANLILECCCEDDELVEGKAVSSGGGMHGSGKFSDSWITKPVKNVGYGEEKCLIHTNHDCVCRMLDEQSGIIPASARPNSKGNMYEKYLFGSNVGDTPHDINYTDKGGASRFFYQPKASQKERYFYCTICKQAYPIKERDNHVHNAPENKKYKYLVFHPTVKPLQLIQYLVRLITPSNGTVIDPFMGTGTTLVAAEREGFSSINIDSKLEYCKIVERRLGDATRQGKIDREPSTIERVGF